jgi:hypothetical protein
MSLIGKDELKKLLDNRPEGLEAKDVFDTLVSKGYKIEGFNAPAVPKQDNGEPSSWLDLVKATGKSAIYDPKSKVPFLGLANIGTGLARMVEDNLSGIPKDIRKESYNRLRKTDTFSYLKEGETFTSVAADFYTKAQKEIDDTVDIKDDKLKQFGYMAMKNVADQLPTIGVGLAAGLPKLALWAMSAGATGRKYQQIREERPDIHTGLAAAHATAEGAIEYGTEMIPMKTLFKAHKNIATKFFRFLISEVPGEMLATAGQNALDKLDVNPDMTLGEYAREVGITTPIVTILSAPFLAGGTHLMQKVITTEQKKIIDDLGKKIGENINDTSTPDPTTQTAQERFNEAPPVMLQQQTTADELMAQEQGLQRTPDPIQAGEITDGIVEQPVAPSTTNEVALQQEQANTAIPTQEKPIQQTVVAPSTTTSNVPSSKQKVSKFYSNTLQKSEMVPDDMKKVMDEHMFTYNVETRPQQIVDAQKMIQELGTEGAMQELSSKQSFVGGADTVAAILISKELMAKGSETGNYDEARAWNQVVREKLTKQGQAIEAVKYMQKFSPEGIMNTASKAIDKATTKQQKRKLKQKKIAATKIINNQSIDDKRKINELSKLLNIPIKKGKIIFSDLNNINDVMLNDVISEIYNIPNLTNDMVASLVDGVKVIADMPMETRRELYHKNKAMDKLMNDFYSKIPKSARQNVMNAIGQLTNMPRSYMAGFLDLSFGLRQGNFAGPRFRKEFYAAWKRQFKDFASEQAFEESQIQVFENKWYELAKKSGVSFTEMDAGIEKREERYASQWAEKIPITGRIVRATGRAYTGFANKMRMDVFARLMEDAVNVGNDPVNNEELAEAAAKFVNAATGRGDLFKAGKFDLENSAVILNALFFSPRLMASRLHLLNPINYMKASAGMRKEYWKTLFSWLSAQMLIWTAAKIMGADVEINILNSDFMKPKVGNTRIDTMGGIQQYIVAAARIWEGKMISSQTGREYTLGEGYKPMTRLDIVLRQLEYKASPISSFVIDAVRGTDALGKQFEWDKAIAKRITPMIAQDIYDLYQDDPSTIPLAIFGAFGAGVQTYEEKLGSY